EHDLRAVGLGDAQHLQDVALGHEVGVQTDDRRLFAGDQRFKVGGALEGRVEDADVEPARFQVRRQVQDAQWRVGLHDLQFVRVFVQKIPVREQNIHASGPGSTNDGGLASQQRVDDFP